MIFLEWQQTEHKRRTCEKYVEHIRDLIHVVKTSFWSTVCIKVPALTSFPDINSKIIKNVFRKIETKSWFIVFINMKLMLTESSKILNLCTNWYFQSLAFSNYAFGAVNVYSNNFHPSEFNQDCHEVQSWGRNLAFYSSDVFYSNNFLVGHEIRGNWYEN